jgi:hypothetical protein
MADAVVNTGVTADGGWGVLGLDVGDSEDGGFWTALVWARALEGLPASSGWSERPVRPHRCVRRWIGSSAYVSSKKSWSTSFRRCGSFTWGFPERAV